MIILIQCGENVIQKAVDIMSSVPKTKVYCLEQIMYKKKKKRIISNEKSLFIFTNRFQKNVL